MIIIVIPHVKFMTSKNNFGVHFHLFDVENFCFHHSTARNKEKTKSARVVVCRLFGEWNGAWQTCCLFHRPSRMQKYTRKETVIW